MVESAGYAEEIDFQKYWLVLKRRWPVAMGVLTAILILTALQILRQKPSYQAEAKIIFKESRTSALTGLGDESSFGQLETIDRDAGPLQTQAEIIKSVPIAQEVIQSLNLELDPEALAARLKASPVNGTDVLEVSFTSGDPDLSSAVVNKVVDIYLESNVRLNRAEAIAAREFIMQQLPASEAAVRLAEDALRQFKEENGIVSLLKEADAAVSIVSKLDGEISEAQARLSEVTARVQVMQSQIGLNSEQAIIFAALSQSTGVQEILSQLQAVQAELAVEQTRYRSGHPTVENLQRKLDGLNALLQERIQQVVSSESTVSIGNLQLGELQQGIISGLVTLESERVGLERRIGSLSGAQASYRLRAGALPGLEKSQRELERRLNAAQTTYETLLTQLQEVQVAENQTIGNARALSTAIISPQRPNRKVSLAMGGGIGLLLAFAAAFAADLLDRSVKTLREARDLFGYVPLAVIPLFNGRGLQQTRTSSDKSDGATPRVIPRDFPFSPIAEAYQMLQANLKFLSSDKELKTIVVTSSVSQEGKSEVAANLAAAVAQVGRRVLLVDANLRHPIQHRIWDGLNTIGLSNVIVEQHSLDAAVWEVMPNLDVLPSGVIPPNPLALLDSQRMIALIHAMSMDYDLVIFDTPSLAGTADAAVLGKLVDGLLLVVRPGVIDSASANAAKEFLKQTDQHVLGMVINGVNVNIEPDSYFYYSGGANGRDFTSQTVTATEFISTTVSPKISEGKPRR
ncbi:MAG: polysaccharide biosynthesis tyrosine autokinase [Cyanobacteria bacterium RM1_2_2]|nr:polysaccharide biosynthesis tyrosine autokinase [Cyanobacteria bacterium RM1_2_2]